MKPLRVAAFAATLALSLGAAACQHDDMSTSSDTTTAAPATSGGPQTPLGGEATNPDGTPQAPTTPSTP